MDHVFVVKGINPATGKLVELTVVATSAAQAKRHAEETGLEMVTARLVSNLDKGPEPG